MAKFRAKKPINREKLGAKLRRLRDDKGLSMAQVKVHTGIDKGYLSRLENAGAVPRLSDMDILAQLYGVTLDKLVERCR